MPVHIPEKCGYCGGCAGTCPENVITVLEMDLEIDNKKCTGCNQCVQVCPAEAMVRK